MYIVYSRDLYHRKREELCVPSWGCIKRYMEGKDVDTDCDDSIIHICIWGHTTTTHNRCRSLAQLFWNVHISPETQQEIKRTQCVSSPCARLHAHSSCTRVCLLHRTLYRDKDAHKPIHTKRVQITHKHFDFSKHARLTNGRSPITPRLRLRVRAATLVLI